MFYFIEVALWRDTAAPSFLEPGDKCLLAELHSWQTWYSSVFTMCGRDIVATHCFQLAQDDHILQHSSTIQSSLSVPVGVIQHDQETLRADVAHITSQLIELNESLCYKLYYDPPRSLPLVHHVETTSVDCYVSESSRNVDSEPDLLDTAKSNNGDVFDCCVSTFHSNSYSGSADNNLTHQVDEDVRLCSLRLKKVQETWSAIYNEVMDEHDFLLEEEDECLSELIDDALRLCEHIAGLRSSEHTIGIWTSDNAAYDLFMKSFGVREGETAVLQYMELLHIERDQCAPVLTLALQILFNNRIEEYSTDHNGL